MSALIASIANETADLTALTTDPTISTIPPAILPTNLRASPRLLMNIGIMKLRIKL